MKLSRELWLRVEPLLSEALAMQASERGAYLAGVEVAQPEAVAAVRRLLQAHDRAEISRELETVPKLSSAPPWSSPYAPGTRIGPFELVRALGHGGMGEVWLARQADGRVERAVALKLPTLHQLGATWRERSRRERDILARLEHSNIARLYDAGVTDAGQPWLAMEFVSGLALGEHVAARSPSIPQRLALFRQVLAAVAHAHRHLVVHRDLKPANILIDAAGQVKLLDFGIAKLLQEGDAESPAGDLTHLGGRPMTLRYAAPEQVEAGSITTATDIYALGVILHELVTGVAPYRAVREGRPLTGVMLLQEEIAVPSGLPIPKPLARLVAGDLDAIVLKAMRRDPAARYASIELFDEDILAHLERRPVKARAGTWRYLAGRFAVRHKLPLALAAAVLATMTVGLYVADRERRVAVAEKARAERHFNSIRHLANSLLFDVHDQIEALSGATLAKQTLVENASKYLAELAPESGDDPDFRRELGEAYLRLGNIQGQYGAQNLGKPREAMESYDRAIAQLAPVVGGDLSGKATPSAELIVQVYRQKSQLLFTLDRFEEATAAAREGLAIAQKVAALPGATGYQRLSHARMVVEYTRLQSRQGDRDIRLRGLEQALALTNAVRGSLPADAPEDLREEALEDIAWMSSEMGHFLRGGEDPALKRRALEKYGEALEIRKAALARSPGNAPKQRSIVAHYTNIGLTHSDLGENREALEFLEKGTHAMQGLLEADPGNVQYRRDVFQTLGLQALVQVKALRYGEALVTARHAHEHYERLPVAVREVSDNQWTHVELLVAEAEAHMGLSNAGNSRDRRRDHLAQARRVLQGALRTILATDGKQGVFSGVELAKVKRLLGDVDAALRE